jgi:hypothetical protein
VRTGSRERNTEEVADGRRLILECCSEALSTVIAR